MEFLAAIPTNLFQFLGYFVAIVLIAARFLETRRQDVKDIVEDSNNLLRDLVKDQQSKIEKLEAQMKNLSQKMATQEVKIKVLEKQNTGLETIIRQALNEYFQKHPKVTAKLIKDYGNKT